MLKTVGNGQSIHQYIPPDLRGMFYNNPAAVHAMQNGKDSYGISSNGLVLWLPFWALKNGTFKSVDAYRHLCTATGAIYGPTGRICDATDDKFEIADNDVFSYGNGTNDTAFSWMSWFNMTDATNYTIMSKGDANKYEYLVYMPSDKITFRCYGKSNGGSDGSLYIGRKYNAATLTGYEGTFICLGGSYDGSKTSAGIKIYLNGSQIDDADDETGGYTAMDNYDQPVRIGSIWTSAGKCPGIYSEYWQWARELSAGEFADYYARTNWRLH